MPDGSFIDAANYAAANQIYQARNAPAQGVQIPVPAPVPPPVTFSAVITPVDNFAGRSLTRFGVGEEIDLNFATIPPGRTAASFGGLVWAVKSGSATLVNTVGNVGTARLTMGNQAGAVVLELRTVAAPQTVKLAKTLWVVEPTSAVMAREPHTGTYHRQNTASAGFLGEIFLRPVDVSFYRCQFREGSSTPVGTGSLAITMGSSALHDANAQHDNVVQELGSLRSGIRHPVMGDWLNISTGHSVNGCKMVGHDTVRSLTLDPPYAVGSFHWDIPWLFRVIGTQGEKTFHTATHQEAVTATGQMTISKAGCTVTHNAADLDSDP